MNQPDDAEWVTRDRAYLDAYGPLSPVGVAPATGSASTDETEIEGEQPIATGTLFLSIILLMLIFGIWAVAYGMLLGR